MVDIHELCRYIVFRENECGRRVTSLRLQRLLYLVQVESLKTRGKPFFSNEFRAWDFGPVEPTTYREYKFFGSLDILIRKTDSDIYLLRNKKFSKVVDPVLDLWADCDVVSLIAHCKKDSPWASIYNDRKGYDNVIPVDLIKKYHGIYPPCKNKKTLVNIPAIIPYIFTVPIVILLLCILLYILLPPDISNVPTPIIEPPMNTPITPEAIWL